MVYHIHEPVKCPVPHEELLSNYQASHTSFLHHFQAGNPGLDLSQCVYHPLRLKVPKTSPLHLANEYEIDRCLFDTGALHNSYIDKDLVDAMRDQWSSCIHKFREPHMVIMADNKTKMLVDEYMFLPVTYDLHDKPHTVDIRLTILKMAKGNDIIIGLPEIARLFLHLFLDMVERFTEMSRKAQQSTSVPQPVHGLTNSAFLSESEKMDYILESRAHLDDPSYSAPLNTLFFKMGRTRSQTEQLAHGPPAPVQAIAAPAPVPPPTQVPAPLPVPIAATPTPIPTVLAPAPSTPTRPVYNLTIPTPPATPPRHQLPAAEPNDFNSISWTQTSDIGIKKHIEETQRERLNYYRAKPIGIDLTRYPTYPTLPPPYQRLAGYMQIHNLVVPEDWQELETPYGHLPLADPTKGNQFTCCAPKLRDFRTFAQIDECNAYCMHEAWPYDLVVSVLVPDTCRCCRDRTDHYHIDGSSGRHDYFNLSRQERDRCHRAYKANTTALPFFPPDMKVTYNNRYGIAGPPQQSTSSSSSALPLPPAPVPAPARERRPRFMRLSQSGIQARIDRGEPYEDDLHPDNSDNEPETKQESLNIIRSSSAVAPEPVADQAPEPVAATSLTLKDTPANQQPAPVHQTITQFCRQHRLNATFKYDDDVPAARRESPETLIERLHHRIMACLVREMQP